MLFSKAVLAGLFAIVVSSVAPFRANAAVPIEFTFGGVFTQTTGTVHQVGAPFTSIVLFDPDALDANPSPILGQYPYISWTAPYRTSMPIVLVPPQGAIDIVRLSGGDGWQISYFGASQFRFELDVNFPPGTFATDALPKTLDLSQATEKRFEAFHAAFGVDLRGTINSLAVRVVPEPALATVVCLGLFVATRRGRHASLSR